MSRQKDNIKAVTLEEYDEQRRGGGRPPKDHETLWESFNEKIGDYFLGMRRQARETLRHQMELHKKTKPDDNAPEHEIDLHNEHDQALFHTFNEVVRGGIKGAATAAKVLLHHGSPPTKKLM